METRRPVNSSVGSLLHLMKTLLCSLLILTSLLVPAAVYSQDNNIRSFDFSNFTYPINPELKVFGSHRQTFTLRNGKFASGNGAVGMAYYQTTYGDVTGDGRDDAIVELGVDTDGGTASIAAVYIYRWQNNRPQFVWSFVSGDRADGGLRNVYADRGQLVVELFGKGTRIGGKIYGTESGGACCPSSVTRTRYSWQRGAFRRRGESEIFPNPGTSANRVN